MSNRIKRVVSFVLVEVLLLTSIISISTNFRVNASNGVTVSTSTSNTITSGQSGVTASIPNGMLKTLGDSVNYTYTGDMITSSVSLFDYVSDLEFDGYSPNSKASGYSDPYTKFNTAISEDGATDVLISPASENVTIAYKSHNASLSSVYLYLFNSVSGENTGWSVLPMFYDDVNDIYYYTFRYDNLDFNPDYFIINGTDLMGNWQTDDIPFTYEKGKSYMYSDYIESVSDYSDAITITVRKDTARVVKLDSNNKVDQGLHLWEKTIGNSIKANIWDDNNSDYYYMSETSDGEYWTTTIYPYSFNDDFYLTFKSNGYLDKNGNTHTGQVETDAYKLKKGMNYVFDGANTITEGVALDLYGRKSRFDVPLYFGCFYKGSSASDYYNSNKPAYSNFFWSANMSSKLDMNTSVQGLVDEELNENGQLTQNGEVLPYFDANWAAADVSRAGLMKSYTDIAFPFYGIEVDASKLKGDDDAIGYAKYYQFNSKESNLWFNESTNEFEETYTAIHSQGSSDNPGGTVGFFPFTEVDDNTSNNLGFGARFDIRFKLRSDGKVETVDEYGAGTGTYVNAMFEFLGDDDVWVYVDNKLVLDLGGSHTSTTGVIDFATRRAYANNAFTFGGVSGDDKDNLAVAGGQMEVILDADGVMSDDTFTDGVYNEDKVHTLTMFYMERGMYESNLLVRYNFNALSNTNTFKIREVTDFSNINQGLIDVTKKAADYDVFNYTVLNNGSDNGDANGILTPVYDTYVRRNMGVTAKLTGCEPVLDTTCVYLDTSSILNEDTGASWTSDGAKIGAYLYTGGTAKTVLAERVSDNLYKVDTTGYSNVHFMRIAKDCNKTFPYYDYLNRNSTGYWNRYKLGSFTAGATYEITDWDNGTLLDATPRIIYEYENHNFVPDGSGVVKTTNYLWTDRFAEKTAGNENRPMAGTTDDTGSFHLMYGTTDKESSAEFQGQFTRYTIMNVIQNSLLKVPSRDSSVNETFSDDVGRTVGQYYTTTVSLSDVTNNAIVKGDDGSFVYNNTASVSVKEAVRLTEVFTNTPKVGAITVTKELDHDDVASDVFKMRLRLYDVFGVSGISVDDYHDIESNVTIDSSGCFTMSAGDVVTIDRIPYGTKYTITEIDTGDNYREKSNTSSGSKIVYEGVIDANNTSTVEDNNETIVNTRKVGNLVLHKTLAGEYRPEDASDTFVFNVTLTAKNGIDLSKYNIDVSSGASIGTYDSSSRSYTFPISVVSGTDVTILGIPYETSYTVSETLPVSGIWKKSADVSGVINSTEATATITNIYDNYGDLCISKRVVNKDNGSSIYDVDDNKDFDFTVTLTDYNDVLLSGNKTYDVTKIDKDGNVLDSTLMFTNGVATVTIKNSESITIEHIVAGYHYAVEEVNDADYDVSCDLNTGEIQKDIVKNVEYVNKRKTCDVIFNTIVDMSHGLLTEEEYSETEFVFEVQLTGLDDGRSYSEYKVNVIKDGVVGEKSLSEVAGLSTVDASERAQDLTFTVRLRHNDVLKLLDLPIDATVNVTEQRNASYIASYRVEGNDEAVLQATDDSNTQRDKALGLDNIEAIDDTDKVIMITFINQYVFIPYELPAAGMIDEHLYYLVILSGFILFGLIYYRMNRKSNH